MNSVYIGNQEMLIETQWGGYLKVGTDDVELMPKLIMNGMMSEGLSFYLMNRITNGDFVVDIGANIGYLSILFGALVGQKGKVNSFEECNRKHSKLLSNVKINQMYDRVTVFNVETNISNFIEESLINNGFIRSINVNYDVVNTLSILSRLLTLGKVEEIIVNWKDYKDKEELIKVITNIMQVYKYSLHTVNDKGDLVNIDVMNISSNEHFINNIILRSNVIEIAKELLKNISNDILIDESLEALNKLGIEIIEKLLDENYLNRVELLNKVAVCNYSIGNVDDILPYLNLALQFDENDTSTLYNISSVLFSVGEYELALEYIQKIKKLDAEIEELMNEIKHKIKG